MSDHKKFKNESQDARRRDQHNSTHPDDKIPKHHEKSEDRKHHSDKRK